MEKRASAKFGPSQVTQTSRILFSPGNVRKRHPIPQLSSRRSPRPPGTKSGIPKENGPRPKPSLTLFTGFIRFSEQTKEYGPKSSTMSKKGKFTKGTPPRDLGDLFGNRKENGPRFWFGLSIDTKTKRKFRTVRPGDQFPRNYRTPF